MRLRVRVDTGVRDLDRLFEPVGEALRRGFAFRIPGLHEVGVDRVRRHLAGELTRRGAAHPVRDDEQRAARSDIMPPYFGEQRRRLLGQIGDEKLVLVVIARAAEVGLGEHFDADRLLRVEEAHEAHA